MVLEYLCFRHTVNNMRVSKGWRDYLSKLPRLWMHLDLSGARKAVPRSFVDKAVRRSENRLTRATIHRFEHVDVLKNIAKSCKSLAEVEFVSLPHAISSTLTEIVQHAPSLSKLIIHPEITVDAATQMLSSRPTLKHVSFNSVRRSRHVADWIGPFPKLETFTMHHTEMTLTTGVSLANLLNNTSDLKTLKFTNLHIHDPAGTLSVLTTIPLTTLVLRKVQFDRFPVLPPTLQRLVIEYYGPFRLYEPGAMLLQSKLPALTHLAFTDINDLSPRLLGMLLDQFIDGDDQGQQKVLDATPLQSVSIRGLLDNQVPGLFNPNTRSLFTVSPRILTPSLHTLDIATLPCNDDEIEHLLSHKTGLASINLSSTQITGASIKMLADSLPSLKSIRAENCPRISGRDAIEYARRKGISVSCSMDEGKGSRKVRYG
tara:strand:+ start:14069 stop:15355 length:1287 start_codon:yes stop_codon:yes gene_type:complete